MLLHRCLLVAYVSRIDTQAFTIKVKNGERPPCPPNITLIIDWYPWNHMDNIRFWGDAWIINIKGEKNAIKIFGASTLFHRRVWAMLIPYPGSYREIVSLQRTVI